MFYAHQGDATDNAFTTVNGHPTRTFRAFETKAELKKEIDFVWEDSGHQKNLIPCGRKFVEKYYGRDFVLTGSSVVVTRWQWENINNEYPAAY